MVIALLALSLLMIVGGAAAVIQGFPYVRLESGLSMVIGGTIAASAGVVLLGLTAVLARLKSVEDALRRRGEPALSSDIPSLPTSTEPVAAGAAGLASLAVGADGLAPSQVVPEPLAVEPRADGRREPALSLDGEPNVGGADRMAAERPEDKEPRLPDLLPPADRATDGRLPAPLPPDTQDERGEGDLAEDDLFAGTEAGALGLRSAVEAADPAPQPEAKETGAPRDALQVVGTYASGGNTYVMFANGSIEADTPRGRFTFNSLDELKAFVEGGGEGDARGAA